MAARTRSLLMPGVLVVALLGFACHLAAPRAFVPAPAVADKVGERLLVQPGTAVQAASAAALAAAATMPAPALALEEDEEGFDVRILAVLALPLTAISWALFNVWRVAFRQVVRIGESTSGSSKIGLRRDD